MMETTGIYKKINGKFREVQIDLEEAKEVYKEDFLSVYPKFFFGKMRKLRGWQNEVGDKIYKKWNIDSFIDFGCASGYYMEGVHNNGAEVKGFEYAYENSKHFVPEALTELVKFGDVQEDLVDGIFEMSFSIEVAEHILPEKSQTFVDNLADSSSKYIILSAAGPGDKGTGHINLRPFDDWVKMFKKKGFVVSESGTKDIRDIFKGLKKRSKYSNILSRKVTFFEKGN